MAILVGRTDFNISLWGCVIIGTVLFLCSPVRSELSEYSEFSESSESSESSEFSAVVLII